MTEVAETSKDSLIERVLSGEDRRLQMLAADGILPLPQEDTVAVQVALVQAEDPDVAQRASEALQALDPSWVCNFLERDASEVILEFFAESLAHPVIIESILQRRDTPHRLLVQLAPKLTPELQEVLLLRQDAIVEQSQILDALAENPNLSSYAQRRIGEYRQHLLRHERHDEDVVARKEVQEKEAESTDEEVEAAIAAALKEIPSEGEVDERTGLSEGQIRGLPVPVRMKLARGASRTLRGILIRDPNLMVAKAVLNHSAISEQEIEQICNSRIIIEEVLIAISRRRQWMQKYPIVYALVKNPRTPVSIAMRYLPRLSVRDLKGLSRNRDASDAVRKRAVKIQRQKTS